MTGYGEASTHSDGVHYFLEVRSLNNKYFKGVLRLPEEYQALEADIESRLRERINRGTVTVTLSTSEDNPAQGVEVDISAVTRYVEQLKTAPGLAGLTFDAGTLLGLPGVLKASTSAEGRVAKARPVVMELLDRGLTSLFSMREREGQALTKDLLNQRALISERLALISSRAPEVVTEYEKRLKGRIEQLLREADVKVEVGDLIREIAIYAERIDIAEEIKRLTGHLEQFGEFLDQPEHKPLGRTLDFLAQEMLREANTIASKSPDAVISRSTVEIKGAIDRIKEQAANVE